MVGGTGFEPVAPTMSTKFPGEIGPQSLVSRGRQSRTATGTARQQKGITSQIPPKKERPPPETIAPAKVRKTEASAKGGNESVAASGNVNSTSRGDQKDPDDAQAMDAAPPLEYGAHLASPATRVDDDGKSRLRRKPERKCGSGISKKKAPALEQPSAEASFTDPLITRGDSAKIGLRQSAIGTTARNAWLAGRVYRVHPNLLVEVST